MARRAALLAICCLMATCGESVDASAQRAYELTLPAGASGTGVSISHESTRTIATWQIRPHQSWDAYVTWVTERLMHDFGPAARHEGTSLLFRRSLDGDMHTLEIEAGTDVRGTHVAVTFTARPF